MSKYTAVKGVKDILPVDVIKWQTLEYRAKEYFGHYGFSEIRVPIFEKTKVFSRTLGDTTDIVEKEMYTFEDRSGESLTLRPEGTASIVRAYVEHKLYYPPNNIAKFYYIGPMFRCERPQAGRFRQFHQIGAEVFGSMNPELDAETISMLMEYLQSFELKLTLNINSLGCQECRPQFRDALTEFVKGRLDDFCQTCEDRYKKNPLRIFDCKSKKCKDASSNAPEIKSFLCSECRSHFVDIKRCLDISTIAYTESPRLVRGLDYYTKTAFEITAGGLGAQNAIAGGGRYDRLVEELGGPPTPAFGFAMGLERVISLIKSNTNSFPQIQIFLISLGSEASNIAFKYANILRSRAIGVERDYKYSGLKAQLKKADRLGSLYSVIIGDNEIENGKVILRDMKSGEQTYILLSTACEEIESLLLQQ